MSPAWFSMAIIKPLPRMPTREVRSTFHRILDVLVDGELTAAVAPWPGRRARWRAEEAGGIDILASCSSAVPCLGSNALEVDKWSACRPRSEFPAGGVLADLLRCASSNPPKKRISEKCTTWTFCRAQ
jgi:hypothetical protein